MAIEDISWVEYVVFMLVLAVSVAIGIFYGCFGSKQKSTKEYLLANRQMSAFPVAVSQICSAVSAITLLSNPVEVYLYGLQYIMILFSLIPFTLSLAYLYIPVYFNLNVNSAYEYIEIRFNATVRTFVSLLAVLHVIVSMAIAIYAPSLAIQQVTGISTEVSTAVIYFVCIFYSAVGGLKAVLWTDVFQTFVMLASLLVIAGKGLADIEGVSVMWKRTSDNGRLDVLNFDPDPRTRHTIWTCIIAGYFFWLPSYAATQVQVQRFLSMPDMRTVRRSLLINMTGLVLIVTICMLTGLIISAKYYNCDPLSANAVKWTAFAICLLKAIEKSDQLVPYFVMETVDGIPGLLGLFTAGLTCASMSSLSSGLTALASITTYDYVNKLFPNLSDFKLSTISKVNTFLLGLLSYSFVFVIQNMGSILPATSSFLGIMVGPALGIFSLGMMFPWANAKGSLSGIIMTFVIMVSYVILNNVYSSSLPDQKLHLSTVGCESSENKTAINFQDTYTISVATNVNVHWKDQNDLLYVRILSVSYMWYSAVGTILTILTGLFFSVILNLIEGKPKVNVPYKCFSPPILRFFIHYFPKHIQNWIDFTDREFLTNVSKESK